MFNITKKEAVALAETVVGIFAATFLGQVAAFGTGIFDASGNEWKAAAASAVAAVVVALRNWFSGSYTAYGPV